MSAPRYRAFRFVNPAFDPAASGVNGLSVSATGGVAMVAGDDSVRQALLLLLSTIPGERVMRPTYGSELHRLVFAPNDQTTAGLAILYVRQAVSRWEPRVDILDVDAGPHPDHPDQLVIRLDYRVRATSVDASLTHVVDLTGTP
jgi:phage baseplate assembly protein W